jgi:hypothetical protein
MPAPLNKPMEDERPLNVPQKHINAITANLYTIRNHGYRLANQPYRITRQFDDHIFNANQALTKAFNQRGTSWSRKNAAEAIQHLSGAVNLIGTHLPNSIAHQEASAALTAAIQSHAAITKQEAEESSNV